MNQEKKINKAKNAAQMYIPSSHESKDYILRLLEKQKGVMPIKIELGGCTCPNCHNNHSIIKNYCSNCGQPFIQ